MRAVLTILLALLPTLGNASTWFTPEAMLSAPRRSAAIPNPDGTYALYTSSSYSFEEKVTQHGLWVIDTGTGLTSLLSGSSNIKDACWLGFNDIVAYVKTDPKTSVSSLWTTTITEPYEQYKITEFAGPVSDLKMVAVDEKMVHFVVAGRATADGSLRNPKSEPKRHSTGRVYKWGFARHWDEWLGDDSSALFAGHLVRNDESEQFKMSADYPLTNLLKGSNLESPVPPFGGSGDYAISPDGRWVAFVAKDPVLNPATNTASYVYVVPHGGGLKPVQVNYGGGASSSPAFAKDGETLAFLQMDKNGYEADKNKVYLASTTPHKGKFTITQVAKKWDRSPKSIVWSRKSNYLYMVAEEYGREKVWKYSVIYAGALNGKNRKEKHDKPRPITEDYAVNTIHTLHNSEWLLVSGSSLTSPTWYGLVNPDTGGYKLLSVAPERHEDIAKPQKKDQPIGTFARFKRSQVDEFWFQGAGDYEVHALVVKPSFFEDDKKYPLAFFIHGGPQSAWSDAWSTRWNPLVFAEQGYVAILFNPTGSTGYGQDFTDSIRNQWGGRPYEDLVNGFEYIENNLEYVDTTRAVALGASYGGYMINWIQGMPLGRKFKALVCHDGVTNLANQWASDELYFPTHDFGGPIFDNRDNYEKWNPFKNIKHWATPEMIIHSMLDFRLPISEGVFAYNILQTANNGKGVDTKFLMFPDENHWVLKPENSLMWHNEVLEWINTYANPEVPFNKTKKSSQSKEAKVEDEPMPKVVVQDEEYL